MSQDDDRDTSPKSTSWITPLIEFIERNGSPFVPGIVKQWASRPTITERSRENRWYLAKQPDGQVLLQLDTDWWLTNNSDRPLIMVSVEIDRPRVKGHLFINYPIDHAIPPKTTVPISTHFMLPTGKFHRRASKRFDFTFIDHNGHRTRKKGVEFKPTPRRTNTTKLKAEAVANIADEDERALVSLLKEELVRYTRHGRERGGLGTIVARVGNREVKHIYQDSWTSSQASKRQDIEVSSKSTIVSEIGDAIVEYAADLPEERLKKFVSELLERIDRDREYYGVSYLIVYVLWRLARLDQAVDTVFRRYEYKPSLAEKIFRRTYVNRVLEKNQRYGYSDVLGLLNGILRFEHASLTEAELDKIEWLAGHTSEHPFQITQKVNSVRAFRVQSAAQSNPY